MALGGGVGSGKSTVGAALAGFGAFRIDADQLAREVVEPGTAGLAAVVERFGAQVLTPDGQLDRPALAGVVFGDAHARADLNAILHPRIAALSVRRMDEAPAGAIVVYEVPLLAQARLGQDFDVVVVVETPMPVRLRRLAGRGLTEADARARIAAQATDEQLSAVADEVIVNDGTTEDLIRQGSALWHRLLERQAARNATT